MPFGPKAPVCKQPLNATVCAREQRTVNTGAECGGPDDYFYYSPWRRPGSAPVIDPCGSAGGRLPGQGDGGFGAQYTNTTHAKVGDRGSKLPHTPSGVTWKAGRDYEVAWTLQANHGGVCSLFFFRHRPTLLLRATVTRFVHLVLAERRN